MIISASRRTDIPSYYSEWLINRLKEQYVLVRNPMNTHQVSKIDSSPDIVDAIIFWTKIQLQCCHTWIKLKIIHIIFNLH